MAKSKTRDFYTWTDDEVELLLKVTQEYKAAKAAENKDWESKQSKYGDILERYLECYPSPEEAIATGKEFPQNRDQVTQGQLTTKLKAIRIKYRQAVHAGRKNGHGRVVLLYSELCESIWGESHVTHEISEGIETDDVASEPVGSAGGSPAPASPSPASGRGGDVSAAKRRRRPAATLSGYGRDKLKRKLSAESAAQQDLNIKRRLLKSLEATDDAFEKTMGRWSSTMDRLNSNIEGLLRHMVGERQSEPEGSQENIRQRIRDREEDVKLLKRRAEAAEGSADEAAEDSEKIFAELIRLIAKRSADVKQRIRSRQQTEASRVKELQEKLQQEISELKRKDHNNRSLHVCPSPPQPGEATSSIDVRPPRRFEDVTAAVSELRDQIQDVLRDTL